IETIIGTGQFSRISLLKFGPMLVCATSSRHSSGTFTTLSVPGSSQAEAFGINDAGDIVGRYIPLGVPEPATWSMLLLGFVVLGFAFRRSRRRGRNWSVNRANRWQYLLTHR